MSKIRLSAYRGAVSWLAGRVSRARGAGAADGILIGSSSAESRSDENRSAGESRRVWIHAASVGELEMLWPVAEELGARRLEIVLSVFSSSAIGAVQRLDQALSSQGAKVLSAGFSPVEGQWAGALDRIRPGLFVSAKYEAWPELWASLSERGIPLAVVGARNRRSLLLGKWACKALGYPTPPLLMTTARFEEAHALNRRFRRARVISLGEPRWDRVAKRLMSGSPRAARLITVASTCPRPWGILGSVWPEDLAIWKDAISKAPGTIWIVPHRVDPASIEEILKQLSLWKEAGGPPLRTSLISEDSEANLRRAARLIVVDEMGFLSELYGAADWAYVGGGFGQGLHSVIEPAIAGLPIVAGPHRAREFPEVLDLLDTGELTLIENEAGAWTWAEQVAAGELLSPTLREQRQLEAAGRLGAARRVADALMKHAGWL